MGSNLSYVIFYQGHGSLSPGMVEAQMMLIFNKDMIIRNQTKVKAFPKTWKCFIPK
jgi:hypothetical protein